MKLTKKEKTIWEIIGYIGLVLLVFGQIAVGYAYIPAQIAFLIANLSSVIRDFKMQLPTANKVRDLVFSGITIGLIIIYIIRKGV